MSVEEGSDRVGEGAIKTRNSQTSKSSTPAEIDAKYGREGGC